MKPVSGSASGPGSTILTLPDIALLIPVYNNPHGLNRTLGELPVGEPVDVVVVDDGSQPAVRVPTCTNGHRVHLIRMPQNRGIGHALNRGLSYICQRGYKYIARLDAGDVALGNRFFLQKQYLEKHARCMLVGSHVDFVSIDCQDRFRYRVPTHSHAIRKEMHRRGCFIHPAVMYRATAIDEVGRYRDAYPAAEDFDLFFKIVERYETANLDQVLTQSLIDPQGITLRRRRRQIISRIQIKLSHMDYLSWGSYVGVLRDLVLLMVPYTLLLFWKRRAWTTQDVDATMPAPAAVTSDASAVARLGRFVRDG